MQCRTIAILMLVIIVGCAPLTPVRINSDNGTIDIGTEGSNETKETTEEIGSEVTEPEETELEEEPVDEDVPKKEVTEGDLVSFPNLRATDPDGDPIKYTFTSPLDENGTWQTKAGDAGEYNVVITASDGVNTVSQEVLVVVAPENSAPEIRVDKHITVFEGDTITLEPEVTDRDGDVVKLSYSGWMSEPTYTTEFDDAGSHKVQITAKDGTTATVEEVLILVKNKNRAPSLATISDVVITEEEKVTIKPAGTDIDNDDLTFKFSEPLNADGEWSTQVGDAGSYDVTVTVSDGDLKAERKFTLTVEALNKAPVIELETPVVLNEGETVTLNPVITDPEGEEVTVSYTGWMDSNVRVTTYEDQGDHTVSIIAKDTAGNEARKDVTVRVVDINRPPTFDPNAFN